MVVKAVKMPRAFMRFNRRVRKYQLKIFVFN
jgi:hypothetical protein